MKQNPDNLLLDTKVLDESGKPLVLYHGTPRRGFTEFDKAYCGTGSTGVQSDYFYFTSSYENAGFYADDGGEIKRVHLAMRNPLVIEEGQTNGKSPRKWADKACIDNFNNEDDTTQYDGVIIRGIVDGSHTSDIYLAFESEQIIVLTEHIELATYNLVLASLENDVHALDQWILDGAQINAEASPLGMPMTALMAAAMNNRSGNIASLLDYGANINQQDATGNTALHWAAAIGQVDAMMALLEAGADVNIRNKDGKLPDENSINPRVMPVIRSVRARTTISGVADAAMRAAGGLLKA